MDTKEILDEIYVQLDRAEVVKDLAPQNKGSYYLLTCPHPQCGKREAYIYKTGIYIKCNRLNNCGLSQSLWDYIQTSKGFSNQETLKELAKLANYTLPDLDGYSEEEAEKAKEQADILESALDLFRAQLWADKGKEILDYLKGRGYTEEEIKFVELGFYPSQKETETLLISIISKGYTIDNISSVGLKTKGFGDTHNLVIPYRDAVGRLKGFIVRSLLSGEELEKIGEKKYKYNWGLKLDSPFNLNEAKGQKDLVVVEGFLDALIANQRGIKGIIALGGSSLTETQLKAAIKYGAKNFILALDSDKAGQDGTEKTIGLINKEGLGAKAFVVSLPDGYKDPDELIRAQGISAFRKLVEESQSGAKWMAARILCKHNLQTDKGRQDALDEALAYEETLKDPIDSKDFLDIVTKVLEIPLGLLEPKIKDYHEKKAKEQLKKDYGELFKEGAKLLQEEKLTDLRKCLEEKTRELRVQSVSRTIKPYILESLQEDLAQTGEGLETAYKSLDEIIRIPQEAITIIAGRPSHGKTTLLLNLCLNMIKSHPDKFFFFFSYEMTRKSLAIWVLNILSGDVIDETQNLRQIENYLKGDNKGRPKIEKGKEEFKVLTESCRLWLIDEPYYVDDLVDTLASLSDRYDVGAVFIDYIQKVKIKEKCGTRQLEIQRISEQILETAKELSIPIILGAQLGRSEKVKAYSKENVVRMDNMREAGDIEQDANLIIGLWNEAMKKQEEDKEKIQDKEIDLNLVVLKNRGGGAVNEEVILRFDRPILTIKDKNSEAKSGW